MQGIYWKICQITWNKKHSPKFTRNLFLISKIHHCTPFSQAIFIHKRDAFFIKHVDNTNSLCIRKSFGHKPIFEYKWVPNRFLRLTWDETITLRQTFLWTSLTLFIKLQQPILSNLSHFNNNLFYDMYRFHVYGILKSFPRTRCVSKGNILVITL